MGKKLQGQLQLAQESHLCNYAPMSLHISPTPFPFGLESPKLLTEVSLAFYAPPPCDLKDSLPLS